MKSLLLVLLLLAASSVSAKPRTVTLDVKDADVRDVLKSMQKQCGIKNLIIDKDVSGQATFLFREVPCETAFKVVLRTFGLASQPEVNSVLVVERDRR